MTNLAAPAAEPLATNDAPETALAELIHSAHEGAPRPSIAAGKRAIAVEDLRKTYGDGTEAVRGISFEVGAGEIFGILGPNGAGKSTTIGVLGTLVRASGGQAEVGGFDVKKDPLEVRRRIGFAMQQTGTDDFATALEFLILQGRLQGLPSSEATTRANLLLRIVDLEEAAEKRLATLSGGMKRRIDLAASLVHLPPILFLDEPTEGLDPRSRVQIWEMLSELRKQLGITLVLSTHYMEEADRLCDRIALIDRGNLVVEESPKSLKESVGSQALVVQLAEDSGSEVLERAHQALLSHEQVERVLLAEQHISVFVEDAASLAPQALRILESADLAPRSISITQPTLEDAYLHYTGRAFDAAGLDATDNNEGEVSA